MCDLRRLELTISRGQFGCLCRQVCRKVSKQASKHASNQASMQVSSGSNPVHRLIGLRICNGSW